jgi:Tfp pilus assembly protein FimT
LATVSGTSYYRSARNARVEEAANEIVNLIQEARSLAIDNKSVNSLGQSVEYKVTINNVSNVANVSLGYKYKDSTEKTYDVNDYKKYVAKGGIQIKPASTFILTYSLPNGDLAITKDGSPVVPLDFEVKDISANRAIKISTNTISGLVETCVVGTTDCP